MSTLRESLDAGFTRIATLLKQVRDDLAGRIGSLPTLNTVFKGSLVGAVNEVKSLAESKAAIDDSQASPTAAWSGQKTQAELAAASAAIVGGALSNSDTLKELADSVAALAQADTGLVSAAGAQTFTDPQKAQARANIGAVGAADVGDIANADFVAVINGIYNA